MTDNTTLNTGSGGDVIGSDDISGVKYQRVKLIHGADGVNAGDVATGNPLPTVQTGALPAGSNNIGDVDVLTVPAPLSTTGGGTEASALRVTVASDTTGVLTVKQATAGNLNATVVGTGTFATQATTSTFTAEDTIQNAAAANGNGTNHTCTGYATTLLNISGTFSATVNFEFSVDAGSTWTAFSGMLVGGNDYATTATAAGTYRFNVSGLDLVRARISGFVSGNVTVKARSTNAPMRANHVVLATGTNTIGTVTAAQATAANLNATVVGTGTFAVQASQSTASNLKAEVVGTGTFAVQDSDKIADNAGFTDGASKVMMAGFAFDETAGTSLTENDAAAARVDAKRAQVFTIEDETTRGRRATVTAANALKVDASSVAVPVTDNSGSITVDAPTGTPVNVKIGDGTLQASVVDETGTNAVDALSIGGGTPHDSVDSGNPLKIGAKALSALPTAVATADRANAIADLFGRLLVSHIDPAMQVWKSANYTTTQTGAAIWTPASGKKVAITSLILGSYATTTARVIIWFGGSADTTYTAGTDQLVTAVSFAPGTGSKPGLVLTPAVPIFAATADHVLRITTDAGISIDVAVYGYEF